jgi:hypothetical protein
MMVRRLRRVRVADGVGRACDLDRPTCAGALGHEAVRSHRMLRSSSPKRNQLGTERQRGVSPDGSLSAAEVIGRWVAACSAVFHSGRSAANCSWYFSCAM